MEENNTRLKTLVQGGAVGIAILLIVYSGWKDKMYTETINNHFYHLTESLNTLNISVASVGTSIDNNTRIMERVENLLDK